MLDGHDDPRVLLERDDAGADHARRIPGAPRRRADRRSRRHPQRAAGGPLRGRRAAGLGRARRCARGLGRGGANPDRRGPHRDDGPHRPRADPVGGRAGRARPPPGRGEGPSPVVGGTFGGSAPRLGATTRRQPFRPMVPRSAASLSPAVGVGRGRVRTVLPLPQRAGRSGTLPCAIPGAAAGTDPAYERRASGRMPFLGVSSLDLGRSPKGGAASLLSGDGGRPSRFPVRPREQVAERTAGQIGQPASAQVLRLVVQDMAALTQRREVLWHVVERVVVEVGRGQRHAGAAPGRPVLGRPRSVPDHLALPAPPGLPLVVPPPAVAEVDHRSPVWPSAALALTLGASEADGGRQLGPVDRVEPAEMRPDRQGAGHSDEGEDPSLGCGRVERQDEAAGHAGGGLGKGVSTARSTRGRAQA